MMNPDSPHAVYRHYSGEALLYVGCSHDPASRFIQHRSASHWATSVTRIDVEWFLDRATALQAEKEAIASQPGIHNGPKRERCTTWTENNGRKYVQSWIANHGGSLRLLSVRLGVHLSTARDYATKVKHPQSDRAYAIAIATDGFVPDAAWHRYTTDLPASADHMTADYAAEVLAHAKEMVSTRQKARIQGAAQ
jgi:predicted GIY-YIG superfamily endonuclease